MRYIAESWTLDENNKKMGKNVNGNKMMNGKKRKENNSLKKKKRDTKSKCIITKRRKGDKHNKTNGEGKNKKQKKK